MPSPEHDKPFDSGVYDIKAVANALQYLEKDDYYEAITAVEDVVLARHTRGYEHDLIYAHALLRPQLPERARQHFQEGYEILNDQHEKDLTDIAARTNDFLQSHPGALVYIDPNSKQQRTIDGLQLSKPDAVHRAAWLQVVNDQSQSVWLADDILRCDVNVFESELRREIETILSSNGEI